MVELIGVRIWAVSYREGRASPPRKLCCGTVVEAPAEARRPGLPPDLPATIPLPGRPEVSLRYSGLFLLPDGDLAAVYGAAVEALGGD